MKETTKRLPSIDLARTIAIMLVVLIHCVSTSGFEAAQNLNVAVFDVIIAVSRFGVPLFAMITGAVVVGRNESYRKSALRAARLLLSLLIFGFAMSLLERVFTNGFSFSDIVLSFLDVIKGELWSVTWYMYMIIGVYLLMPLLSVFARHADNKTMVYVMSVLFVFNSLFVFLNDLGIEVGFYLPSQSIYLLYVLAGYYIYNRYDIKIKARLAFAVMLLCVIVMAIGGYCRLEALYSYDSPFTVITTVVALLLLKNTAYTNRFIRLVSSCSFGIYFVHCFYVHILTKLVGFMPAEHAIIWSLPIFYVIVFFLSLATVIVLKRLPVFKKLI